MPPAARLGDPTAHGGVIMSGFPTVLIGGMPAARLTDMHTCPMVTPGVPPIPHVGGPISGPGVPTVLIGGMPAACVGDMAVCVGPPSTIIMGCPTVLIGPGGGGGGGGGAGSSGAAAATASAVQAMSGDVESTTKEKHWIEYQLLDKAGNPVSGVDYKFTDTDNKVSFGKVKTDGRITRDSLKEGECNLILKKLFNAKWSKELVKPGDKVELTVESEGLDDGEKVNFSIWERDINKPDSQIGNFETQIQVDKAKTDWEVPASSEQAKGKNKEEYSAPQYYFTGLCNSGLTARSGMLYMEDTIEIELKDDEGNALANEEFLLYLPDGKIISDKLDSSGYKKIEKVPAGSYSIKFPKLLKKKE
jgi:uncharacterized Zn-binding protein involved in type VI secretion